MHRGELRLVDFEPVRGSEANKRRPAIVVSNDRANAAALRHDRSLVSVVPVTSNVSRILPFQVRLAQADTGLRTDSKAQCEQVRAVATERVGRSLGQVPPDLMTEVDDALRLHLGL